MKSFVNRRCRFRVRVKKDIRLGVKSIKRDSNHYILGFVEFPLASSGGLYARIFSFFITSLNFLLQLEHS